MTRSVFLLCFSLLSFQLAFGQSCDTTISGPVIDGAMVSSNLGNTIVICSGDGFADPFTMSNNTASAEDYAYVVTDTNTEVLALSSDSVFDFEGTGSGECWVWGLNYTGSIMISVGDTVNTFGDLTDSCFDLSDNFVVVQRTGVDGASVTSDLGDTLYTCVGDGIVDPFTMSNTSTSSEFYVYIVTTPESVISTISIINTYNFEGTGPGQLFVWGLSFSGSLLISTGDTLFTAGALSTDCYALSQNYVVVNKTQADGALVSSNLGDTLTVCAGDGSPDSVLFSNNSASAENYIYLITTPQNVLLATSTSGQFDFEGAGGGICRVWGLSYSGAIIVGVGDTVDSFGPLTDDCYDLSDNFIVVTRVGVEGGDISSNLGDTIYTCPGDGIADSINFTSTSMSVQSYSYIVTDPYSKILAINNTGIFDFEVAGVGECWVWGLSYAGNLLLTVGDTLNGTVPLSDSCYSLSTKYSVVIRTQPDGGLVSSDLGDSLVICAGDGNPDPFTMNNNSSSESQYVYIVTTSSTEVLAISSDSLFDFDLAGEGECWVWGLSYTGSLTVNIGDTILNLTSLSDDCYDLSGNYVVVQRTGVDGGEVTSDLGDTLSICAGDGIPDPFVMSNNSVSSSNYLYLITDNNTEVLGISLDGNLDLDGAGAGECWVWGLSYTGNLMIGIGDTVSNFGGLTDSCYGLSANFVVVFRSFVDGATVNSSLGDSVEICSGDGFVDLIIMNNTSTSQDNYIYVTTDNSTVVLSIDTSSFLDLNNSGQGECWVWGLSYSGNLLISSGDTVSTFGAFSDECYDLSTNFIVVEKTEFDGGIVTVLNSGPSDTICVGDGVEDTIYFDHSTVSDQSYTYIITDDNDIILAFASDFGTFENAGVGVCRVYGVSYNGNLIATPTDNVTTVFLSDSCWDLSSNFIEIYRENCSGINSIGDLGEIEVYPNPASHFISIRGIPHETIRIINIEGQVVWESSAKAGVDGVTVDISAFSAGVYAIIPENSQAKHFIKE